MLKESYKVGLYTLGCKVSLYETEAVAESFADKGFAVCSFEDECDVYVINTCTVTQESDAKSRKYIRRAVRKNPEAVVIVMGCYSQRSPDEVGEIEGVDAVIGTADKLKAVEIALELLNEKNRVQRLLAASLDTAVFEPMRVRCPDRTRAFVKIEDGCECRCTYCAISDARGPVRSKARLDVIEEVEALAECGTKEVVLTGIETGSYGKDFSDDYGLADLIFELSERKSVERIRLGSMAPELLGEDFARRVMPLPIMVSHVHISMQSASDNVLRAMKRRYNKRTALENIDRIRKYRPETMFTADLMVGFPGESEEDFLETLEFVSRARLLDAHVFAYSKRKGTPAADCKDQVPECVKKQRSARLISECRRVRDEILSDTVSRGEELSCIFESRCGEYYTAHSDSYLEVRAKSKEELTGKVLPVIPLFHKDGIIYGEIAK